MMSPARHYTHRHRLTGPPVWYFGNGQGITIYSHLDEAGQLTYSTVFGTTSLIGVEFGPRFASIHHQQLYTRDAVSTYKEQPYRIHPNA